MHQAQEPSSPLANSTFRAIWIAGLASGLGTYMHNVGAAWEMTELTESVTAVALLQSATALPALFLGAVGGALADIVDRRRLLLTVQFLLALVTGVLAAASALGDLSPVLLLGFTFAMGALSAVGTPTYLSIVPSIVERPQLASAMGLQSLTTNLAQAIGPIAAGVIISRLGIGWVFALNSLSFLVMMVALQRWHPHRPDPHLPAEHIGRAISVGFRYVRHEPRMLSLLIRSALQGFSIAGFVALIPSVARGPIGLDSVGYGVMAAGAGVGSLFTAWRLDTLRVRLGADGLFGLSSALYIAAMLVLAAASNLVTGMVATALGGAAYLIFMATVSTAAQSVLPDWVRGRGLAVMLVILQGSFALGSATWGWMGDHATLGTTLVLGAVVTAVQAAIGSFFSLRPAMSANPSPAPLFPELNPTTSVHANDGPVLVTVSYRVQAGEHHRFVEVMRDVGRARRREGAVRWDVYNDVDRPGHVVESFTVATWAEHERQRSRTTAEDVELTQIVHSYLEAGHPPRAFHLVAARQEDD
ncbi:MAG: MFS transporter [Acidimicrobiia bacterium]|nr:MFS transporter [Acidimicrobiia bacterium]MBP8180721.1 MFS transporter [Acidimicrobiia bacterium]